MFSLGQRIRELRMKKGITQIDLAKGICTPSMVSQIESDRARPSYKILFTLAERLEVSVENLLSDVDLNLEYASSYKMARAMVADRQYVPAIPLLQEVLTQPRGLYPASDIMQLLAECYLHTDQLPEAEKLLDDLSELAVLHNNHELMAEVLLSLSLIDTLRKQFFVAIFRLEKAYEEAKKLETNAVYLQAKILYHLGQAYAKTGQVVEAQSRYELALSLYEGTNHPLEMARLYLDLSKTHRERREIDRATEYAERAEAIFQGLQEWGRAIQLQVHTAALYAETGREQDAISMLEEAIVKLQALELREEEGMAQVELAKVHERLGDANAVEACCKQARYLLPDVHVGQMWVHRLLGRVALRNGQHEEAIGRFKKAAALCKTLGSFSEWDRVMQEISSVYAEDQQVEIAYEVLMESRQRLREALMARGIVL